jgi:cytochrome c-type biogenesis protein CcmH
MTSRITFCLLFAALLWGMTADRLVAQETLGADKAIIGEPLGQPLSGSELNRITEDLTDRMRCPVCQGLSIADSDTMIAMAMKEEVRQFLAAGYTEEQILLYFEASYGEFIRLEPKPTGFNLLVWIAPVVALLIGFGIVAFRLRSREPAGDAEEIVEVAEDDELAAYRERVRREIAS